MVGWLNYMYMRYRVGMFWREVAHKYYHELSIYKPSNWDCDERVTDMIKELESYNFRPGYDFVADRGTINGVNHVRLNVCGMMVDPATDNEDFGFKRFFLGRYIKPDKKDKETFMATAQKIFTIGKGGRK